MADRALSEPLPKTVSEFLEWSGGGDTRYEMVNGKLYAMAPPSGEHSLVAANLGGALKQRLKPPCRVFSEAGIRRSGDERTWFQADLAVSCTPLSRGRHEVPEPVLVVEILSPGTERFVLGIKLMEYQRLASIKEILVLRTDQRHVMHWHRGEESWLVRDFIGAASLELSITDQAIPLDEIYEGVPLEEESGQELGRN